MSVASSPDTRDAERSRIAAEVLELGETRFEAVVEAGVAGAAGGAASIRPHEAEEVRAAAAEFFSALRLLLGLEPSGADVPPG